MARPTVTKVAVKNAQGVRLVTRTYPDGRTSEVYEARLNAAGRLTTVGTFPKLAAARKALNEARASADGGTYVAKTAGAVTFLQVAEEWMAGHDFTVLKARTQQSHRQNVYGRLTTLHRVPVNALTPSRVDAWMADLARAGLAPATRQRYYWVLRAVCDFAVLRGYLAVSPAARLKKPKAGKTSVAVPEPDDVRRLLAVMRARGPAWHAHTLLVELAVVTGMRAGELAGLRVRALDLRNRRLTVRETVIEDSGRSVADTPKSDAGWRVVDNLDAGLCVRLAAYIENLRPEDYVWGTRGRDGTRHPLHWTNWYRRIFTVAKEEAGLPDLTFHHLRHYHVSEAIEAGLSPVAIAARVGHADASITLRIYAHQFERKVDDTRVSARLAAVLDDGTSPLVRRRLA